MRLAKEVGLVVGEVAGEFIQLFVPLGVAPQEMVVVEQRAEVKRLQAPADARHQNFLAHAGKAQSELLLDQIGQEFAFDFVCRGHAAAESELFAISARALRAVRATTGSISRTRASRDARPSGNRSRPSARAASLRSAQSSWPTISRSVARSAGSAT